MSDAENTLNDAAVSLDVLTSESLERIVSSGTPKNGNEIIDVDRAALKIDLESSYVIFRLSELDDLEHTAASKMRELESLCAKTRSLTRALQSFEAAGRPGWDAIREAAKSHFDEVYRERYAEMHRLAEIRNLPLTHENDIARQNSSRRNQRLKGTIDYYIISKPEGIFQQVLEGTDLLEKWLRIVTSQVDQARKGGMPHPLRSERESADHQAALRWIVKEALPRIYLKHFHRRLTYSKDRQGLESGPGVRFVEQVLAEFKIRSLKSQDVLNASGIIEILRDRRSTRKAT